VEFVDKVRDQAAVPNVAALVEQMNGDVANARLTLTLSVEAARIDGLNVNPRAEGRAQQGGADLA
jgi:hypothetical protein